MSNPRGSMTFSAVLKEVDVTTTGADGVEKKYVLRELVGRSRDQFMNAFRDRAKFDSEGNMTGLSTYEGSQSSLLAVCLFDEAGNLVPEKVIQEFPVTMLEGLFDMAQEISSLNKEAKAKSKNG